MHSMYETEGWFSGSIEASQKLARENSRLSVTHATTGFSAKWRCSLHPIESQKLIVGEGI